jgi:hypothetical protein
MGCTYKQYIQHHLLRLWQPEIVDFGHASLDIFHDFRSKLLILAQL